MNIQKKKGFTLAEIMTVLVIISVIAGLAVPGYFKTVEQSRSNEAITNLNIIHMGEKIYRLNNPAIGFWGPGNTDIATMNGALGTDMTANFYTTASITKTATSYTAKLTRNNASGGAGTKWFQFFYDTVANANNPPTQTEGGAY